MDVPLMSVLTRVCLEQECDGRYFENASVRPPPLPSCRHNLAHKRQSRPDSGLGFQAKVLKKKLRVPFSPGSSGDTPPCKFTSVILHGAVRSSYTGL